MEPQIFANVWDALEDDPEAAATMTMPSDVMASLTAAVRRWNMTHAKAARRLGLHGRSTSSHSTLC
jgi:predicted XRE-type DNA-binding protein